MGNENAGFNPCEEKHSYHDLTATMPNAENMRIRADAMRTHFWIQKIDQGNYNQCFAANTRYDEQPTISTDEGRAGDQDGEAPPLCIHTIAVPRFKASGTQ
jgi:hypothetical protein